MLSRDFVTIFTAGALKLKVLESLAEQVAGPLEDRNMESDLHMCVDALRLALKWRDLDVDEMSPIAAAFVQREILDDLGRALELLVDAFSSEDTWTVTEDVKCSGAN